MYVTLLYPPATKLMLPIFVKARHIRKVVLCVLLEEWRAVLGKVAEDPRIRIKVLLFPEHPYLRKKNPQKIRMRFSRMKHAISEKLYFVYYLRNGVLSSERSPKIRGFKSAECLEDFSLSEHQNIRKAVLCVLPKEFCVRRNEKDPMIQGFKDFIFMVDRV